MQIKILGIAFLITASTLWVGYASDRKKLGQDTINEAMQGNEDIQKSVEIRQQGRKIQKKGKNVQKKVKEVTVPLKSAGTVAGNIATASGDIHAKIAAATFQLAVSSAQGLGEAIGAILIGVGRYQERSQEILSITEALVEDATKSQEKITYLEKKQKEILDLDKAPEPSQSSSRLKKLGKSLGNVYKGRTDIQQKVREATDIFTDEKAKRLEKLKTIQAALKAENENYSEIIRVLQIKLMQDTLKEIDRKINIDATINKLKADLEFYKISRGNISTESRSQAKKQLDEIEKQEDNSLKELAYYQYLKFQNPQKITPEQLQKDKSVLVAKINELVPLTKLGESIYLQEKGLDTDNLVRRTTIVGIYREMDEMKKKIDQIEDIKIRLETLEKEKESPSRYPGMRTPSGVPVPVQLPSEGPAKRVDRRLPPQPLQKAP
jgi:hypothetical protein